MSIDATELARMKAADYGPVRNQLLAIQAEKRRGGDLRGAYVKNAEGFLALIDERLALIAEVERLAGVVAAAKAVAFQSYVSPTRLRAALTEPTT